MAWHSTTKEDVLNILHSTLEGLPEYERELNREKYGSNEARQYKKKGAFALLISQLNNILTIVLLIAALLSGIFGDFVDVVVILVTVVLNVIVGFIQEWKAESTLESLSKATQIKAKVYKAGDLHEFPSTILLAGDIIHIEAGDMVPADARILESVDLKASEAPITGESMDVHKQECVEDIHTALGDQKNMIFAGTTITHGWAKAVVVAVGVHTEMGKISQLVHTIEDDLTPLQKQLSKFTQIVGIAVIILSAFLFVFGLFLGQSWLAMVNLSVAIIVSAVPEGLIIAVTVILAIGMKRILERKGLVRKLVSAETLGSVEIICTDKTGTLTTGVMRLSKILTAHQDIDVSQESQKRDLVQNDPELSQLMRVAMLANDALRTQEGDSYKYLGDTTDIALAQYADWVGFSKTALETMTEKKGHLPFSSDHKYLASMYTGAEDKTQIFVKGAFDVLIDRCDYIFHNDKKKKITEKDKAYWNQKNIELSTRGFRLIAVAYKTTKNTLLQHEDIQDLVFVGIFCIKDPVRTQVMDALEIAKTAGIQVVMITGDHVATARAIAKDLGIETQEHQVMTGQELALLDNDSLEQRIADIRVFARVTSHDKLRIIHAWKKLGKIVAMTGDGVNDAPALKRADIGIAMGNGTEVAKQSSDLVLLENNFEVIVAAVEEGRVIYDNIRKVVLYLLSDSLAEVIVVTCGLFFGWPLVLLPVHILWINLIDDGLPSMALTMDRGDKDIMKRRPHNAQKQILSREGMSLIFIISVLSAIMTLGLFYYIWKTSGNLQHARTLAFTGLACSSLLYIFSCRSLRESLWVSIKKGSLWNNTYLLGSIAFGFLLQISAIYIPFLQKFFGTVALGWKDWILLFVSIFVLILCIEIVKWFFLHRKIKTIEKK